MVTAALTHDASIHRVAPLWRWVSLAIIVPLLGLAVWGTLDIVAGLSELGVGTSQQQLAAKAILFGSLCIIVILSLLSVYRSRVTIAGDTMMVHGMFRTYALTPATMEGYEYLEQQYVGKVLQVYLKNHKFAVSLKYFEHQKDIEAWVRARAYDVRQKLLDEEEHAIAQDASLGVSADDKTARLAALRNGIKWGNALIYAAAGAVLVNFWLLDRDVVEQALVLVMVAIPLIYDLVAFTSDGRIRVDYHEGSRYPQIASGSLAAGVGLGLISLIDRGAVVDERAFWELLGLVVLIKGLVWCAIDRKHLARLDAGFAARAFLVAAYFLMVSFWCGGAVYQLNKHLDRSETLWHQTQVVDARTATNSVIRSYYVDVAPWDPSIAEPVEITLGRADYEALAIGDAVRVGVRAGAFDIAWIAAVDTVSE